MPVTYRCFIFNLCVCFAGLAMVQEDSRIPRFSGSSLVSIMQLNFDQNDQIKRGDTTLAGGRSLLL